MAVLCLYIYIYIHTHIHECIYIHMYIRAHIHTYRRVHTHICISYTYIHIQHICSHTLVTRKQVKIAGMCSWYTQDVAMVQIKYLDYDDYLLLYVVHVPPVFAVYLVVLHSLPLYNSLQMVSTISLLHWLVG